MKKLAHIIAIIATVLVTVGCVQTKYETKDGVKFSRTSVLNKSSIGKVKFNPTTGQFEIEGYSNQQTEALAAVAGAVAAAK